MDKDVRTKCCIDALNIVQYFHNTVGTEIGAMQEQQRVSRAKRKAVSETISVEQGLSDKRTALALNAANLSFQLIEQYQIFLEKIVFSIQREQVELDEKDYLKAVSKLRGEFSRQALTLVWKESPFVTEASLLMCGFGRAFEGKKLNKNSLATAYCKTAGITDLDKLNAVKTDVQRLCWAAEAFGLISYVGGEGKGRPFEGTERLNELMLTANTAGVRIIDELLRGGVPRARLNGAKS